ncbi:predicted protein [Botrytis cinerea T4]|uniref:Uncharacterized protein n=1 Tax=Botryotinia fuckeliana (strain T4) TaxID=999810 RepID=G2XZL1_BOTF4|nr:predicted protein [Botrytis cinerea T4]
MSSITLQGIRSWDGYTWKHVCNAYHEDQLSAHVFPLVGQKVH